MLLFKLPLIHSIIYILCKILHAGCTLFSYKVYDNNFSFLVQINSSFSFVNLLLFHLLVDHVYYHHHRQNSVVVIVVITIIKTTTSISISIAVLSNFLFSIVPLFFFILFFLYPFLLFLHYPLHLLNG